ncbi:MAG: polyhydroxyalkanoic acid system family protein [bacterium]
MADIEIQRTHQKQVDDARDSITEVLKQQDRIESITWDSDGTVAKIQGTGFEGEIEVQPSTIVGRIELTMMARPFKDEIEQKLINKIDEIMD